MRIENNMPQYYNYTQMPQAVKGNFEAANEPQRGGYVQGPGVILDISPKTWAAYVLDKAQNEGAAKTAEIAGITECKTCESRRYVDQSNDPSVSFQTPTHISPGQSASMVMAHEREHVGNEQARAEREGSKVIDQTVTLSTAICPECKRMYVSGGTTRTMTMKDISGAAPGGEAPAGEATD